MLVTGGDDGVYAVSGLRDGETTARHVLESEQVFRLETFDGVRGLFAATADGLFHSTDGTGWTSLGVPATAVYAVCANPAGTRIYAGTRPADLFVADCEAGLPSSDPDWRAVDGFGELAAHEDWGIDRHDGISQVRSLDVHPAAPDRLVAGIEVGGVYVSEDGGNTWSSRCIDGFDAPHTDDIHHLTFAEGESLVAATGSGLYRSPDLGETWDRLDANHPQRYFRESFVHDGSIYAGGAPRHPSTWDDETDHALFVSRDGQHLERESTPRPEEVTVGWCSFEEAPLGVTNHGTLLRRQDDTWQVVGSVPIPESIHGRCLPLVEFPSDW